MKKIGAIILPIFLLIGFVLIMNGGDYLKKPRTSEDNFVLYANLLKEDLKQLNQEASAKNLEKLSTAWKKIIPRIQYSVEKDEINAINVNIARLQGYISIQNYNLAIIELYEIEEHWHNLNN